MTTETKLAELPPLPATYAAGTFAPDVPVYDAGQMRAYAASALARQEQESALQVIEQIAQQWDGCMYDAVGETIDIGDAIRRAGKRRIEEPAPPAQAVDLEQFREAVKAALQWAQFSGDDSDRARFLDLLDLIDQQAGKEASNG